MIWCVDDDAAIRDIEVYTLCSMGHQARGFTDGKEMFEALETQIPELILLDIMLPGEDGVTILKKLRAHPRTAGVPVIMATAKGTEMDKIQGLNIGADDYVTKPFVPLELLARVRSQLRRYERFLKLAGQVQQPAERCYVIGGLELNEDAATVCVDGAPVKMTPLEFKILALLMKHPGRVFSAEEIYERVWNERAVNTDTIMVHVRNIREKIEIDPRNPKYLKVVWGIGYKIEKI